MGLSPREQGRYARQMTMAGWGVPQQERLRAATVFVAGAGGLGSPLATYLAVAGVGRLRICDCDTVELSNLNRQILHDEGRLGLNKALSARRTLERLNPDVCVEAQGERITEANVDELVGDAAAIVDCMDNFATRFVLNGAAIRRQIPLVHGSVWGMEGRLAFVHPPRTACLRCLFPEAPPAETFPVLGATAGVIGALQAMETLKWLTGVGHNLTGRLLVWDGSEMEFRTFRFGRDPRCPACGG
ncbi:MAG: HesA/MoeB/ThiF family protein [Candidatus Latescibacterota bacterium]